MKENELNDCYIHNSQMGQISKINGNSSGRDESEDDSTEVNEVKILDIFQHKSSSMFNKLLPLIFGYVACLANSEPKSSVQILNLIRDILPHVAALNKLSMAKFQDLVNDRNEPKDAWHVKHSNHGFEYIDEAANNDPNNATNLNTTSNYYCVVESDHPYKSASITNFT